MAAVLEITSLTDAGGAKDTARRSPVFMEIRESMPTVLRIGSFRFHFYSDEACGFLAFRGLSAAPLGAEN